MTTTVAKQKRRGIQSVGIGLNVLSALAKLRKAASLSAIAQEAGVSPSQTHRYLSSLMAAGMVKQEQRSGLYDLDSGAIAIGLAALARNDVLRLADEVFSRVADETGYTCLITIWGDSGPTIIRWFDGDPPVVTSLAIGSTLPLVRSATGRVFYAFEAPSRIKRLGKKVLDRELALVEDPEGLRAEVRRSCIAEISGDLVPGLQGIAAPVFDLQGRLILVASALSAGAFIGPDGGGAMLAACKELTASLGGKWPEE